MSNLLIPVDSQALEAVTGGASSRCSPSDPVLKNLTDLSNTLKSVGCASKKTGFSITEILMLGLLMNRNGPQVNVFVRRHY
jgi:hypothetical protein